MRKLRGENSPKAELGWGGKPTVPLQEGPHERINPDELQLNVISVEGDPLAVRKLFDHNAVLLRPTRNA